MYIEDIFNNPDKNRKREKPSFANINIIGKCNLNCYFCIGNEVNSLHKLTNNSLQTHFTEWPSFGHFLDMLKKQKIKKVYLTGLNTDPSLYHHLDTLVLFLMDKKFSVGIRTNGYVDITHLGWFLNDEISYSVSSLIPEVNEVITGTRNIPDWDKIIPSSGSDVRIAITVNRYNYSDIFPMIKYFSQFDNIKYIQLRCVCTDKLQSDFSHDILCFQGLIDVLNKSCGHTDSIQPIYSKSSIFKGCPVYKIYDKKVCLWDPFKATINSLNYFTDGVITDNYFITEGYCKKAKYLGNTLTNVIK